MGSLPQIASDGSERWGLPVNEESVCSSRVRRKIMSISKCRGFRGHADQKPEECSHLISSCQPARTGGHLPDFWACAGAGGIPVSYCTHKGIRPTQHCCLPVYSSIFLGVWLALNAHIFSLLMKLTFPPPLVWVIISSFSLSKLSLINISPWLVCLFKGRWVEPRICR